MRKWITEKLGVTFYNWDMELLDSLFTPDCSIMITDGKRRTYFFPKEQNEEIWNTEGFSVTDYRYGLLESKNFWGFQTYA